MITINQVWKNFGRLEVLKGIDLEIRKGKVTAILGPNGAGKTTLFKSILGLVRPDRGTITVNNQPVNGDAGYRRQIGYMPQIARYPENLTVSEIFAMISDLRTHNGAEDRDLIESFRLETEWEKPFKTLSGGNRQKVSAALACLFDPEILFLDEPTAGLDPVASSSLKDKIEQERRRGKTILLTSHVLSEVEEMADHIVYLLDGHVNFDGSLQSLLEQTGQGRLERAIATIIRSHRLTNGAAA